jgi:hypothetical protein
LVFASQSAAPVTRLAGADPAQMEKAMPNHQSLDPITMAFRALDKRLAKRLKVLGFKNNKSLKVIPVGHPAFDAVSQAGDEYRKSAARLFRRDLDSPTTLAEALEGLGREIEYEARVIRLMAYCPDVYAWERTSDLWNRVRLIAQNWRLPHPNEPPERPKTAREANLQLDLMRSWLDQVTHSETGIIGEEWWEPVSVAHGLLCPNRQIAWITRNAAQLGAKIRPAAPGSGHRKEVEIHSLFAVLKHQQPGVSLETEELARRIRNASEQRRNERPLN